MATRLLASMKLPFTVPGRASDAGSGFQFFDVIRALP